MPTLESSRVQPRLSLVLYNCTLSQAEASHHSAFLASVASHHRSTFRPNVALATRRRESRWAAVRAWHARRASPFPFGSTATFDLCGG